MIRDTFGKPFAQSSHETPNNADGAEDQQDQWPFEEPVSRDTVSGQAAPDEHERHAPDQAGRECDPGSASFLLRFPPGPTSFLSFHRLVSYLKVADRFKVILRSAERHVFGCTIRHSGHSVRFPTDSSSTPSHFPNSLSNRIAQSRIPRSRVRPEMVLSSREVILTLDASPDAAWSFQKVGRFLGRKLLSNEG